MPFRIKSRYMIVGLSENGVLPEELFQWGKWSSTTGFWGTLATSNLLDCDNPNISVSMIPYNSPPLGALNTVQVHKYSIFPFPMVYQLNHHLLGIFNFLYPKQITYNGLYFLYPTSLISMYKYMYHDTYIYIHIK